MSEFGDAAILPPEANYTLMSSGDLGTSLLAAVAGHETVADMLLEELTAMGINASSTAMIGWQGPGGTAMEMSAAEFIGICTMVEGWVREGQVATAEMAAAHATALDAMIPAEVSLTNRSTQAALVATNVFGIHTGEIAFLEGQYQAFWVQNATQRTVYGGAVTAGLSTLATPAPFAPNAADPAEPALGVAQAAAQDTGESALQNSSQAMTQVANEPSKDLMGGEGSSMMGELVGQFGSMAGQFGQVTQMGQQLPQMLGQAPQMFSGMLGPLTNSMGMGGATQALAPEAAAGAITPVSSLGGATSALGGGGGGLGSGGSALSSTFVRPASSFNPPGSPTLPTGWQGGQANEANGSRGGSTGGGGMYGAPPASGMGGRGGQSQGEQKSGRPMQVTSRAANRGEQQRV
ncbi:PPE domain-containing protein [Mycolicibacterium sp. CBMA 226]|uniref:PPE domain-containing protein n=1 Tax=Mycolicibacterium sp. CBMA 226 TaxID=2606611 RepID=UPI0012DDFBC9|nr:PPE domain-containing protein [Mycolicibacterium sp. CBMA 226]MUL78754.1 PPE domain-containing protein [Mycolicibacterium sp. CBMA 226]QGW61046.1 putative PPE family protein PPE51 [Mycolicibacterium sp.]